MDAELAAVQDFLRQHAPFDTLPDDALARAVRQFDVVYVRQGEVVLEVGQPSEHLYVVRSGAIELRREDGALVDRVGEGEAFGYPSLLTASRAARRATALEDTLLYRLPAEAFHALRHAHPALDRHYAQAHAARVRAAVAEPSGVAGLAVAVRALVTRPPVTAPPALPVRAAAERMREARVSSLMVCEDERLVGIVTDRDLRNRVLAAGVSPDVPLADVMTPEPVFVAPDALAFEALLTMTQANLHHLPVVEARAQGGVRPLGMVTATDLMRRQALNPVYLVGDVAKAATPAAASAALRRLPDLFARLVEGGASAADTGRVVSAVVDALVRRLLVLAEEALGPPPVPYVWLALGSHARFEQTAHTDQDHALLLADAYAPETHGAYFRALAAAVSDGLHEAGFAYCPGGVMATNDRWRQPLARWRRTFEGWIGEPRPKALMHASIFFDFRALSGEAALAEQLRQHVLARAAGNGIFLASMAQAATEHQPPLGFFRRFVLERSGEHKDRFDLKLRGTLPLVDLARLYALAAGRPEVRTGERLRAAAAAGALAPSDAASLEDAYEFIARVRMQHQAAQIRAGRSPDNYVSPEALSPFERRHLRDAFTVVATAQDALAQRYVTGLVAG
ncbi:MAG: putative nucleotidyltransferase substrate binding domain-containing protein [Rubricoccaceae bacterium]